MPHVVSGTGHFEHCVMGMDVTINGTARMSDVSCLDISIDGNLFADDLSCVDIAMPATIGNSFYGTNISCSDVTLNGGAGFQDIHIDGIRTGANPLVVNGAFVEFDIRGMVLGLKASSAAGVSLLDVDNLDEFTIEGTIYRSALHGAVFDVCTNGVIDLNIIDPSAATDNTSDGISLTGACDGLFLRGAVQGATLQANNPRYGVDVGASCTDIYVDMAIENAQTGDINNQAATGEVRVGPWTSAESPNDNDVLVYESSSALYRPEALSQAGVDSTAIHDDTAAEISAITEKTNPVGADLVVIEDSADSNNKKRVQLQNIGAAHSIFSGFGEDNLAASLTDSQLYRQIQTVQAQIPVVMAHPGDLVGISVASSEARTAGTATFEVFLDGTGTGLTTVLDATDTQYASNSQAIALDTFTADQRLDVRVTTDVSWAPTTADVEAAVIVRYDD